MTNKSYKFYESNPLLQEILDELVRNRQLTPTIHSLILNGLGKDIKKTKKLLEQRVETINKVDRLYKKIQTQKGEEEETLYQNYRKRRKKIDHQHKHFQTNRYNVAMGMEWLEIDKSSTLHTDKKKLLKTFEKRYEEERK